MCSVHGTAKHIGHADHTTDWSHCSTCSEDGFHSSQDKKIRQITHYGQHIIPLLLQTRAKMDGRHIHCMHKNVKQTRCVQWRSHRE